MRKGVRFDHLRLGCCYYPEQWDEALWEDDLDRMAESGIEVVRVFEFAWNFVEPEEGVFDFSLFDRFFDLAERKGMRCIMCTPTATPPAWLTSRYPEVLNRDMKGNTIGHGHRRHYNYNSTVYRRFTAEIVTKLAVRYANRPCIVGWQIDNEINCEIDEFYSDADRVAFREYLKKRFGTLKSLDDAIGGAFWNQSYSDWSQVDLERNTIHGKANPHMSLLEKQFFSESAIGYVKLQADILRSHIGKDRFVTTNGYFGHLDNYRMTEECLDFLSYDCYPNFAFGEEGINASGASDLKDRDFGKHLSYVRAISPNFVVMEMQSGANGWDFSMLSPMPLPGQMRLWTFFAFAHGADMVSYFRWRTAAFGTEIYWHGLNDYSNRPNRRLRELKGIGEETSRLAELSQSTYRSEILVASDYLSEWDGERDRWHGPMRNASIDAIYCACQKSHAPVDFLYFGDTTTPEKLSGYKLVFYPHPTILTEHTASLLASYVAGGGIVVFGARTGYKDEFGRCPMRPMPGLARDLCGVVVDEYSLERKDGKPIAIAWDDDRLPAPLFRETLVPDEGVSVLGTYDGGYLAGKPALTEKRSEGGGAVYYLGCGFSQETVKLFLRRHGLAEPFANIVECDPSVEVAVREKEGAAYCFVLNFLDKEQTIELKGKRLDLLSDTMEQGTVVLPPFGVRVYRL
jgi:beta-galactosidase